MSLKVLRAGAGCSIQDFGRVGYGRFGVPRGGAFDLESLSVANSLLGNEPFAPALEISFAGAGFVNEGPDLALGIAGAPCNALVGDAEVPQGIVNVPAGTTLEITHVRAARVYIALPGGVQIKPMLGSCSGIALGSATSTYGTTSEICHRASISRPQPPASKTNHFEGGDGTPDSLRARPLRFIAGPQSSSFDLNAFQETTFMVSVQSDRRGLRLKGQCIGSFQEIASQPVCAGAVQVTNSGMPILLGPDGPTVGGYPLIGCVVSADLNRVGQLVPGDEVKFVIA